MSPAKLALDLPVLLPDALDGRDRCVERLSDTLREANGLDEVHVVAAADGHPARLCLHYDPAATSLTRIRTLAERSGATITDRYRHLLWTVTGISHVRRARTVAETLRRATGVIEADVTPGLVRLEFDSTLTDIEALRGQLSDLDVQLADRARATTDDDPGHDEHGDHDHRHGRRELWFAIAASTVWLAGFLLEHLTDVGDDALTALFAIAGVLGGWFAVREAATAVRNGRFEIDFLMLVAAAGAASIGRWEEGALLLALFSLGHALEGVALGRARAAIAALAELTPSTAIVRRLGAEHTVAVDDLQLGDLVVVRPHARIPADGFVVAGTSSVDQSALTGESIPVDKQPVADVERAAAAPDDVTAASRLYSGTMNGSGPLDLQVTRRAADSTLAKLATLVRDAETQGSPTQRFTDRFERVFVPFVLATVVAVLFAGRALGSSWTDALYRSMAVLVAAGPCALAIATPSAVLAAVARAGQLGVLVKGGGPLEHLGTLRAVAFDKTGTLTEGRPRLVDVVAAAGIDPERLLAVAVAVESHSDHPLAAAVRRDGGARLGGIPLPRVERVVSITGRGVTGVVDGAPATVGSVALLDAQGHLDADIARTASQLQADGRTIIVVAHGSRTLGVLGLMDTPRDDAAASVAALAGVGIHRTVMLSGDHQRVADSIARCVGIDEAWGDLMPEDKVTAITRLREEEGKVAMVGDGVNDAPALAHATVGIAMGAAGSDIALETADIALMGDDLSRLATVVGLSRRASRIIRQNLVLSVGMVAFLVPATIAGAVGIGPAVVLHEGSTLIVVANALRLLAFRPPASPMSPRRSPRA